MFDLNNNKKEFNLPSYINIPFFLYQDSRLEKSATLIASFFYSLHTAGKSIKASKDYLCELASIKKTQYFFILNQLESFGYIERNGFTNRKEIKWVHRPKSEIIVDETDTSPVNRTSVKELNTSSVYRTKLVRSTELNLSGLPDTDIKEDTKDNKKLTTVNEAPSIVDKNPSSSSFFSEKQKAELLEFKLSTDERTDALFLDNCNHHVEKQTNDLSKFQRFAGLKHILVKLYETGEQFNASGFNKNQVTKEMENKIPSQEDFNNYKKCIPGYEWVGSWMQKQRA